MPPFVLTSWTRGKTSSLVVAVATVCTSTAWIYVSTDEYHMMCHVMSCGVM